MSGRFSRGASFALVSGVLVLGLGLAHPPRASGQSGSEVRDRQRNLKRVKDEEERQRITLVSKGGATKDRTFIRWTLSGTGDLDKIMVRFVAPRDVENTGLLTWEAKDGNDDQWLYLPATKKPKRIAASGKKNRFMGSDFAFEDLRPESNTLNKYTLVASEPVDGQDCLG